MKYKYIKIITLILITIIITTGTVKARPIQPENLSVQEKSPNENKITNDGYKDLLNIYGTQDDTFTKIGSRVLGIVSFACYAAAIIVIIYKGVQFMNKAPEAKAELKKELINVAIGAFILAAAGTIVQVISNIAMGPLFG